MAADNTDEIEFSLKGLMDVLDGFHKIQVAADQTGKSVAASLKAAGNVGSGNFGGGSGYGGGSRYPPSGSNGNGGNGGGSGKPSGTKFVSGPRQRMHVLDAQFKAALALGDKDKIGDVGDALKRNTRLMAAQQPKSLGGRLTDVLKTTRLNIGDASPLIGRTLAALGPEVEALAGPIGLVVGAATLAAKSIYDLASSAADAGNSFSRFQIATGSSGQTSAQLQRLGTAAGLSPDRVAAVSQNIQSAISSDPTAMAAGMRLGVFNLPGAYGQQDYGKNAQTVLQHLRQVQDPNERLRLARAVHAEDLLPAANTSSRQQAYETPDANVRTSVMTPKLMQESADFQDATGRVGDALQNLVSALGPTVLPRITDFLNSLANAIETFTMFIMRNQSEIEKIVNWTTDIVTLLVGDPEARFDAGKRLLSGEAADPQIAALKENTQSHKDNTDALNKTGLGQPGSYGNITRQGGLGDGMNGYSIVKAQQAGGLALSTF